MQQDLAAAVEGGAERVEADLAGRRVLGGRQPQGGEFGFDRGAEAGAGCVRGDPAAGGADEHGLEGAGQRPAAAERFTLAEDGGDGFEELAAAGRGQRAQSGEVAGEPQGLGGLAGACGVPGAAQLPAERGDGDGGGLADPVGVTAGFEDGLLPAGSRIPAG